MISYCLALPCLALPCLLSCLVLSCLVLLCLVSTHRPLCAGVLRAALTVSNQALESSQPVFWETPVQLLPVSFVTTRSSVPVTDRFYATHWFCVRSWQVLFMATRWFCVLSWQVSRDSLILCVFLTGFIYGDSMILCTFLTGFSRLTDSVCVPGGFMTTRWSCVPSWRVYDNSLILCTFLTGLWQLADPVYLPDGFMTTRWSCVPSWRAQLRWMIHWYCLRLCQYFFFFFMTADSLILSTSVSHFVTASWFIDPVFFLRRFCDSGVTALVYVSWQILWQLIRWS